MSLLLQRSVRAARVPLTRALSSTPAEVNNGVISLDEKTSVAAPEYPAEMPKHVSTKWQKVTPWMNPEQYYCEPAELPKNPEEVGALSGTPRDQRERTCVIQRPGEYCNQNDVEHTRRWELTYPNQCKEFANGRWINPLMGWGSTNDAMSTVKLSFNTKEEAIKFAEKCGHKIDLREDNFRPSAAGSNNYSFNFLPEKIEALTKSVPQSESKLVWNQPTAHQSHYVRPLTFHGDRDVVQHGGESKDYDYRKP